MKTPEEKPLKLIYILFDPALLKRVGDFCFENRIESRSEAVRWLMKAALDQKLTPKTAEKGTWYGSLQTQRDLVVQIHVARRNVPREYEAGQ
jgi:metal-responsive CopG/Arc/MetJ family transcriptional regulator